jgi:hypothetical protein
MPKTMNEEVLLGMITAQYLGSHDFNGLPVRLAGISIDECRRLVRLLVENGRVSVNFGDRHSNPHILAFEPEPATEQLAKLDGDAFEHACLYPTRSYLATATPADLYADRPFSRMLALGEPQLGYRSFDLSVLEGYRNDPRFLFEADISGSLSIRDSGEVREADQVFIQTFGFSYSSNLDRAVAVPSILNTTKPRASKNLASKDAGGRVLVAPRLSSPKHGRVGNWNIYVLGVRA